MYSKQQGFTLIELVVVIVILGILAATALPKFVDLSKDARGGVMGGVEAAMRGADTMIYAKAAAAGKAGLPAADAPQVTINGTLVALDYGYAKDVTELNRVLSLNPAADFDVDAANKWIAHVKAADYSTAPGTCAVAYAPAADKNTPPTYTATITGC